jgi:hypothetical protein
MTQHSDLNIAQRHTLGRLFQPPLASNLKWPQILSLLHALGQVTVESNGRYRVTVQGHTEVFRPPGRHGDITPETIIKHRHLLRAPAGDECPRRGPIFWRSSATIAPPSTISRPRRTRSPRSALTTRPGICATCTTSKGSFQGQRSPEDLGYYRRVAGLLETADSVVILAHGDGHSDAGSLLAAQLRDRPAGTRPRHVYQARADIDSLTGAQLLATARAVLEQEEGPGT